MFSAERDFYSRNAFQPAKRLYVSNVPPFIKDELNTEFVQTNSFTNDEVNPLYLNMHLSVR